MKRNPAVPQSAPTPSGGNHAPTPTGASSTPSRHMTLAERPPCNCGAPFTSRNIRIAHSRDCARWPDLPATSAAVSRVPPSVTPAQAWLKPYVFVTVTGEMPFPYVGELMSYPIPAKDGCQSTIMVRRLPDHPGTLVEVELGRVTLHKGASRAGCYVHYARVKPLAQLVTSFPVGMLAYDRAIPVTFTVDFDTDKVTPLPQGGYPFDYLVATVTPTQGNHGFTIDRWLSFGWSCEPFRAEKLAGGRYGN